MSVSRLLPFSFLLVLTLACASDPAIDPPCTGPDCDITADITEEICTPNACGGCLTLSQHPGESCGDCGVLTCEGEDALRCEDPGKNACGGCTALQNSLGGTCGHCGTYVCDGLDALDCDEKPNSCGGCSVLAGVKDESCGECDKGKWVCISENSIVCEGDIVNECGGCTVLSNTVGRACGTCGGGRYECDGQDAVICAGENETNECGGCAVLQGTIGDPCGLCLSGTLACNPSGSALMCVGAVTECDPCNPVGGADGNETLATARNLGSFADTNNAWITHSDALHNSQDVDVFRAHVNDTFWGNMELIAGLRNLDANLDLCVYWTRDDGKTVTLECPDAEPITKNGIKGCCSRNLGTTDETVTVVDKTAAPGGHDSGTIYYEIFTGESGLGCQHYDLVFRF